MSIVESTKKYNAEINFETKKTIYNLGRTFSTQEVKVTLNRKLSTSGKCENLKFEENLEILQLVKPRGKVKSNVIFLYWWCSSIVVVKQL